VNPSIVKFEEIRVKVDYPVSRQLIALYTLLVSIDFLATLQLS
jgi:hypothetical protein